MYYCPTKVSNAITSIICNTEKTKTGTTVFKQISSNFVLSIHSLNSFYFFVFFLTHFSTPIKQSFNVFEHVYLLLFSFCIDTENTTISMIPLSQKGTINDFSKQFKSLIYFYILMSMKLLIK